MQVKKILVPVDFTRLSDKVIEQAAILCDASGADMVLFHCAGSSTDLDTIRAKLTDKAVKVSKKFNVTCNSKVIQGSIFNQIPAEAENTDYQIMVIGTHGVRGLKQKLLGADILKLIVKVPVPVLVIQSTSSLRRNFERIIFPVATHKAYENILKSVVSMAKLFDAEVHIYMIERPLAKIPEQLKKNLQRTIELFEASAIRFRRINEKQTVASVGFALQTLQYADKTEADMLAIMSASSEEYHYFAKQDKENLLTNKNGIPVMCASNLTRD